MLTRQQKVHERLQDHPTDCPEVCCSIVVVNIMFIILYFYNFITRRTPPTVQRCVFIFFLRAPHRQSRGVLRYYCERRRDLDAHGTLGFRA
jgi:hypothetical protein